MSYYTRMAGTLGITPQLTWGEIQPTEWRDGTPENNWSKDRVLTLELTRKTTQTADGELTRITSAVVAVTDYDECREGMEDVVTECRRLLEAFPGHRFRGVISGEGENHDDVWHVVVEGRRIGSARAEMVFPEPDWTYPDAGSAAPAGEV